MTVYVVMGNDFPDAVFDSLVAAERYVETKKGERQAWERMIYWRIYDFPLQ